ncbi:MAG: methylated-DNA--[Opitutales bacterium]|nr:methylated-DNA--[protein]-cysteine S-methyltransferase [Opitutales bacterium]
MKFVRDTNIGKIEIDEEGGFIIGVRFCGEDFCPCSGGEPEVVKEAFRQIEQYLCGRLQKFTVPIKPEGTEFQKRVWQNLLKIPYGKTATYKEIAIRSGNSRAVRAVGMANNRNPIAIIIPCHRVVSSGGRLGGYAGGAQIKVALLKIEGAKF